MRYDDDDDDEAGAKSLEALDEKPYYKDGFIPTIKALSNLTKSIHNLNSTADNEE